MFKFYLMTGKKLSSNESRINVTKKERSMGSPCVKDSLESRKRTGVIKGSVTSVQNWAIAEFWLPGNQDRIALTSITNCSTPIKA